MSLDKRNIQSLTIAGAAVSATVAAYLYKTYTEEIPQGIHYKGGNTFLNLHNLLSNVYRLHDFQYDQFQETDSLTL